MIICKSPVSWHGCYKGQTALWVDDAYAHPAKAHSALAFRILQHLEDLGLLTAESVVLDPMAGVGTFPLAWAAKGGRAILVELEPRFIGFCQQNKAQLERTLGHPVEIEIIQGDSRHLSELLKERGLIGVTSPPYEDSINNPRHGIDLSKIGRERPPPHSQIGPNGKTFYGIQEGQIGNLPDHPLKVVTSPPYEDSSNAGATDNATRAGLRADGSVRGGPINPEGYGQAEGQIGQEQGGTYLSAMFQVYQEIGKVADVLVTITKNPTRKGKLRDLTEDTERLLVATGWNILCRHRAILFEEMEQGHLFEGSQKQVKGRLSFFKRLSWQKGSPVAQWEDVLIAMRGP